MCFSSFSHQKSPSQNELKSHSSKSRALHMQSHLYSASMRLPCTFSRMCISYDMCDMCTSIPSATASTSSATCVLCVAVCCSVCCRVYTRGLPVGFCTHRVLLVDLSAAVPLCAKKKAKQCNSWIVDRRDL